MDGSKHFEQVTAHVPEVFWVYGHVAMKLTDISPPDETIHGCSRANLYEDPRLYIEAVYPGDRTIVLAAVEKLRRGEPAEAEYRVVYSDGTIRWIHNRSFPLLDNDGRLTRTAGIATDVTDRREAEGSLRESETRLRLLFETMVQGVVYQNAHGEIISANPAAQQILGLTLDQMQGRTSIDPRWRAIQEDGSDFPGETHPAMAALRTGQPVIDVVMGVYIPTENEYHWINVNAIPQFKEHESAPYQVYATFDDITERKRAEDAARTRERQLQALVGSLDDIVFEVDAHGTYVNVWTADDSRLFRPAQEVIGKRFDEVFGEEASRPFFEFLARTLTSDTPQTLEYSLGIGGKERWFAAHYNPIHAPDAARNTVSILVRDITERKQAERALQRNERILRLFVEHTPAAVAMLDREMRYIVASRSYLKDYGLPAQDIVGQFHYEVFPEIPERWKQIHQRCLAGAVEKAEEDPFPRADGSLDWVHWEIHPWYEQEGVIGGIILFSEVITERILAEERLRESEERFRILAETSPFSIFAYRERFIYANRAFELLTGYTLAELQDMTFWELVHPDARALVRQRGKARLHGESVDNRYEVRLIRKDGSERSIDAAATLIQLQGQPTGLGTAIDITERMRAEALLYAQRDLARAMGTFQTVEAGFQAILETALRVSGLDSGGIYLFSPDAQRLELVYHQGLGEDFVQAVGSYSGDAPNAQLALTSKPYYFSHNDPAVQGPTLRAEGLRALASVPILYQDRVIGCFNLASHAHDEIPAFARQALETLTVEVGNLVMHLQGQASLRAGEEKFRQIADTINEVFWIFDNHEQKLVYLNPAYEKVWAISAEATYRDSGKYTEAIHPDDRPLLVAARNRQVRGEQTELEYRIVRPDGAVRWIFDRSFPIVDEDGQVLRTTGVAADITERKLAEQLLQTRMEDLALINKLNAAVNRGENLTQITQLLAEEARTLFGSVSASIYLLDRTKQRLILQHFTMPPDTARRLEELSGRRLPQIELPLNGDDHFSRILATEEGVIYTGFDAVCAWLSDFANTSHLPAAERPLLRKVIPAAAELLNIKSVLSLPLKRGDGVLGLIELTSDGIFDASALARLQNVRQQLAEIIARKQVDEALRESEERYRSLAEASDAIIVLLDVEGCIHYLNERATAVQGVEKTSRWRVEDTIDRTLHELLPGPIVNLYLPRIRQVIATDESIVLESPVGDKVYRTSIQPIHDEQGKAVLALLSAIDITPLKQVQNELQELNRSLEARVAQRTAEVQDLYDNAPTGYHSLDANGRFVQVNQTELNWLGYTHEELLGRSVTEILTTASQATFQNAFPTFKQYGFVRDVEIDLVRKDGSTLPVLLNATAAYDDDGSFVASRSTLFDNTERKRAEQALRESEEQNRLLFENTPDAVVLFDEQGQIVRANQAFSLLAGFPVERCIGSSMASLGLLPESQVVALAAAVVASLQNQGGFASAEFKIIAARGDARDVGVRVYGVTFDGRHHFLTSMRDITTEKQAEVALRLANAEIERALRMKDEFLANMSHELRTPLHGILAMTETLLDQIRGPLNERQQKSVRLIEESGQHLLALINDLLDLSKIEAGKLELHFESLLVDDICGASLQFVRTMALKKEIQVEYANPFPGARLSADAQRLKQMLVNLLSNAVKFTPNGGRVELGVRVELGAGLIHFAVQDTGPGIAVADQSRLFQPFVQVDSHLARQYEGTGLGLALVKRLAEQHGGTVRLDSSGILGEGCLFTITLPYAPAPLPVTTAAAQPGLMVESGAAAPDSGPLLLLAEDNEVSITAVEEYLRYAGYRIAVARTGTEALALAAAITPDLILMDVHLPLLDGLEVTRRLRAEARFAVTPIIAVTAAAMPGDRERCLAAGTTEYLSKPLRLKELLALVSELAPPAG